MAAAVFNVFTKFNGKPCKITKRDCSKGQAHSLGQVDATKKVYRDEDGKLDFAEFTINNVDFKYDFKSKKIYYYSFEANDWIEKRIVIATDGDLLLGGNYKAYPHINLTGIGAGVVHMHLLVETLVDDAYYKLYAEYSGLQVNHCIIASPWYNPEELKEAMKIIGYDPQYLETINQSWNKLHSDFIYNYGLFGIYVSARDIVQMEQDLFSQLRFPYDFPVTEREDIMKANRDLVYLWDRNHGYTFELEPLKNI